MRRLLAPFLAMIVVAVCAAPVRAADMPFVDSKRPPNALELQADAEAKMIAWQRLSAKAPALGLAWQKVTEANAPLAAAQIEQGRLERQPDIWTRRIAHEQAEADYFGHLAYYKAWDPDVGGWVDATNASYQRWRYSHLDKLRALQGEKARFMAALAGARAATVAAQAAFEASLEAYTDLLGPYQKEFTEIWGSEYRNRKAALIYKREKAKAAWAIRKKAEKAAEEAAAKPPDKPAETPEPPPGE